MSDKSCKNCKFVDDCTMHTYAKHAGVIDKGYENWGCSDFEPKKKTVKLYRYTYEDNGRIEQSTWTTDLHEECLTRWRALLKTEVKEVEI